MPHSGAVETGGRRKAHRLAEGNAEGRDGVSPCFQLGFQKKAAFQAIPTLMRWQDAMSEKNMATQRTWTEREV